MALTSAIGAYPYPALSDPPNAQTFGANLTAALDLTTLPKFTSDAAVALAIPSPTDGQRVVRTDIGVGGASLRWSASLSRWIADHALIAETVLGAPASSVSFSSIPQYWTHLRLVIDGACAATATTHKYAVEVALRFNGDTTQANYTFEGDNDALDKNVAANASTLYAVSTVDASGGTSSSAAVAGRQRVSKVAFTGDPGARVGFLPGESLASVMRGNIDCLIPSYTTTAASRQASGRSRGMTATSSGTSYFLHADLTGGWATAAAITTITAGLFTSAQFATGTAFRLYGF